MKKIIVLATFLGFAATAQAQAPFGLPFSAVGWDNNLTMVTARLPQGENAIDLGLGFKFDNAAAEPFSLKLSGTYLHKTNTWGPVSNYLAAGAIFRVIDAPNDNIGLGVFGGFQPEVTVLDRLILSAFFGTQLDALPEFVFQTVGTEVSIVGGMNFKILF